MISTFNKQKLVSQDQLTLHIYRLAWEDQEQHDNELKKQSKQVADLLVLRMH